MSTETDPMIGKTIQMRDGRTAVIQQKTNDGYRIQRDDGRDFTVSSAYLNQSAKFIAAKPAAKSPVDQAIADYQRNATGDATSIQARAARVMEDLKLMRAGLDPLPMNAAEKQLLLDRLDRQPPMHIDAEALKAVRAHLDGKSTKTSDPYAERIGAEVHRLIARKK